MAGITESGVLHACLEELAKRRVFAWRNNSGAIVIGRRMIRYGHPGSSDILGILPDGSGRLLAVECKSKTGKQSADQKLFEQIIRRNNGVYVLARSCEEMLVGLAPYLP